MPWFLQWEEELRKLDELLALLAQAPPSPEAEIAQEHIESARSCVLRSMPAECELDLELARTAIGGIAGVTIRRNAQKILLSLPSNRRANHG
jgi:hypothetical protein